MHVSPLNVKAASTYSTGNPLFCISHRKKVFFLRARFQHSEIYPCASVEPQQLLTTTHLFIQSRPVSHVTTCLFSLSEDRRFSAAGLIAANYANQSAPVPLSRPISRDEKKTRAIVAAQVHCTHIHRYIWGTVRL